MTLDEFSLVRKQQLAYWVAFKEFMDSKKSPVKCSNGSPQHWMSMRIGKRDFWLAATVNSLKSVISANFGFTTQSSKDIYHVFHSEKETIEAEFGEALEWSESSELKSSTISVTKHKADFRNEQDWKNQFAWLAERLEKLDSVFRKRVLKLDVK
jgi:hypothetical protein